MEEYAALISIDWADRQHAISLYDPAVVSVSKPSSNTRQLRCRSGRSVYASALADSSWRFVWSNRGGR